MKKLPFLFTALFLAIPLRAQSTTDARTEILAVLREQVNGWNNGDIASFMAGYAQSDSLRFASGSSITYGWKNMLARYQRRYTTRDSMGTLDFSGISVTLLGTDAALAFGTWRLTRTHDQPWGLFTLLFRRIDGRWRIVHDHTSSAN